jgi:hypothetical protein
VRVGADRVGAAEAGVRAALPILVLHQQQQRVEVGEALAHALGLLRGQAAGIAHQPIADVVAPLVGDQRVVERAVARDPARAREAHVDRHAPRQLGLDRRAVGEGHRDHRYRQRRVVAPIAMPPGTLLTISTPAAAASWRCAP